MEFQRKFDKRLIILIVLLIPFGFAIKFYDGVAQFWVNNSFSDVVYVVFWSLVLFAFRPASSPLKIAALVFLLSSLIEFTQLWSFPLIEKLRTGLIGKSLFGNSFVISDFFYYFLGSLLSYYIIKYFQKSIIPQNDKKQ